MVQGERNRELNRLKARKLLGEKTDIKCWETTEKYVESFVFYSFINNVEDLILLLLPWV